MGKNKAAVIAGLLAILAVLFNGSCSSGKSEKKETDLKQLLHQAIQGIEKLQKENRDLRVDLEHVQKDKIVRENKSLKEIIEKTEKENKALKEEAGKLKGVVAHTELQLKSREEKITHIAELEKENKALQDEMTKVKGLLSFTRLQLESKDDQSERIAELEKKNAELNKLLEKINAIAKGQK